jgi:hypothetical protein
MHSVCEECTEHTSHLAATEWVKQRMGVVGRGHTTLQAVFNLACMGHVLHQRSSYIRMALSKIGVEVPLC